MIKPGKINNKKRGFLFLKKFNFCGFIHWHQSQEYYCTFLGSTIFINAGVGNIHR
jgi:hypothetical protein